MRSLSLLLLLSGCSLAIDTDQYRPNGSADAGADANVPDGATDAIVDASNVPTMPTVHISPASPTARDALTVEIDVPSGDPRGDSITYAYAWSVDGDPIDVTDRTIGPMRAKRGETWSVTVTPIAGNRMGPPGTASVEIVNAAPELDGVSVNGYDLVRNETAIVYPSVFDADGDTITFTYQWTAGGEPKGANAPMLPGAQSITDMPVMVDVTASDGMGGEVTGRAGPITFDADEHTRFRQLSPDRTSDRGFAWTYDTQHRRVVFVSNDGSVWEYAVDRPDARLVRLDPTGPRPNRIDGATAAYDPLNHRMLMFRYVTADESVTGGLFVLDLARRGSEAWTRFELPTTLENVGFASIAFDHDQPMAYLVASHLVAADTIATDVTEIDFANPSSPAFRTLAVELPAILGVTAIKVPNSRQLYLVGGGELGPDPTPASTMFEVDLDAVTVAPMAVGGLPEPMFAPLASVDPASGRILYGFGGTGTLYELDPSDDSSTPVPLVDAPGVGAAGMMAFDARTREYVVIPGLTALTSEEGGPARIVLDIYRASGDAELTFTPLDRYGESSPPALASPSVAFPEDMRQLFLIFGETDGQRASPDVWRYDLASGTWGRETTMGPMPGARYGNSNDVFDAPRLAGGIDRGAIVTDGAWSIDMARNWVPIADSPLLDVTGGFLYGGCEPTSVLRLFGGTTSPTLDSPSATNQIVGVECIGPMVCAVAPRPSAGAPPARAFAAFSRVDEDNFLMFGGLDGATRRGDLYTLDRCTDAWTAHTILTGGEAMDVAPAGRFGHTLTRAAGSGAAVHLMFGGRINDTRDEDATWAFTDAGGGQYRARRLEVPGENPLPRSFHVAVWDREAMGPTPGEPRRGRLLIYGGKASNPAFGDPPRENDFPMSDLWELRYRPEGDE